MATSLVSGAIAARAARPIALHAVNPRIEYKTNPLGIDVAAPRFSWELMSNRRGQKQNAYEILVASNPDALRGNRGDIWDSGKVASDKSAQIDYAGPALRSAQRCFWKVHVWDGDGKDAGYSPVASYEMGLLLPTDWKAQWVGVPGSAGGADQPFANARWIWTAEEATHLEAPVGTRCFRYDFAIAPSAKVASAALRLTADDQFTLYVNGKEIGGNGTEYESWKRPKTFDIAAALQPGANVIAIAVTNTTPSPAGLIASLTTNIGEGRAEPIARTVVTGDNGWKCADAPPTGWQAPTFSDASWQPATVVAKYGAGPWGKFSGSGTGNDGGPGRYLRRAFHLSKPIQQARLYATALGAYEPYLNGLRVGGDIFAPGWTDYHKRVQYQTYDVTGMVHVGDNAAGMILSDGWYAGHIGLVGRAVYGPEPLGACQLRVDYTDGTSETIATDGAWKGSTAGPIVSSDLQSGETYDARREMGGWSTAGYDDSAWKAVPVSVGVDVPREAERGPAVRRQEEMPARAITHAKAGAYVFDIGQNMVGWARLKVKGKAGSKVTLRFAEMLNPDGTIYTTNYRGARCVDEYTLRGGRKTEFYEPHFTFRGFRYVEVTGYTGRKAPGLDTITGVVVHSDTPRVGHMDTSSPMVNQLLSNIDWGQRGNFLSIPTDCPQRDERLGWMGDAQIFVRTATYNRDVAGFFTKWLVDVDDAQAADGAFTDVSPHVAAGAGTAAWGDAGVICPWTMPCLRRHAYSRGPLPGHDPLGRVLSDALQGAAPPGIGVWRLAFHRRQYPDRHPRDRLFRLQHQADGERRARPGQDRRRRKVRRAFQPDQSRV